MARNRPLKRPGALALVMMLALCAVAVFVVGNRLFVVSSIDVEGNRFCSKESIIAASGISINDSMFGIDTNRARAGINQNRYLTFVGLWRSFPGRVILRVSERAPHAMLTWTGMLYMLDEKGLVLEETPRIDMEILVPVITGMQVQSAVVGLPIVYAVAGQGDAIAAVLAAIDEAGMSERISELNVSSLDNLYLVTQEGLQIDLGTADALGEKLALTRAVLPELAKMADPRGGVLDVSSTITADFRPAATPTPSPSPLPEATPSAVPGP